jgi:protein-S-isoprenylcysteine O-methyltransferase Ste14
VPLREELEAAGHWLFRWRSYLPLLLFAPLIAQMATEPGAATGGAWDIVCVGVATLGLVVRAWAIGYAPAGTSGRNTRSQVAQTLTTTGPYSLLRHPLYLGNYLMWLGPALFVRSAWVTLLVTLAFWLYYERIMLAEEEFLRRRFGDAFESWAARTPAFVPNLAGWAPPALPFSWKNVLQREYSGLFGMIATFAVLVLLRDVFATGRVDRHPVWLAAFLAGAVSYVVLRTLKRHTSLLDVDGR